MLFSRTVTIPRSCSKGVNRQSGSGWLNTVTSKISTSCIRYCDYYVEETFSHITELCRGYGAIARHLRSRLMLLEYKRDAVIYMVEVKVKIKYAFLGFRAIAKMVERIDGVEGQTVEGGLVWLWEGSHAVNYAEFRGRLFYPRQ